jgi:uncharacterized protein
MTTFLLVTFAWSWGIAAAAFLSGWVAYPFADGDKNAFPMVVAFMCGPMVGAIVAALQHGSFAKVLRLSFRPNLWWLRAWAFPVALVALALAISIMLPDASLSRPSALLASIPAEQRALLPQDPLVLDAILIAQAVLVGAAVNSILLINEELGWRGFMLSKLAHRSFWSRHLTIGFVWGIWHIPIVAAGHNYPGEPIWGPAVFTVWCMLLAPVIGHFSEQARSVFGATIFHGTLNAAAPLSVLSLHGLGVFERGIVGWPGMALLVLCCLWLLLNNPDAKAPSA